MLRPQPTLLDLPLRAPPCQLSPFDVILDWAGDWRGRDSILLNINLVQDQSYRGAIFVDASLSATHSFACSVVCERFVGGINPVGEDRADQVGIKTKRKCPLVFLANLYMENVFFLLSQ